MVRWFISPVATIIVDGALRRYPSMCLPEGEAGKDKYQNAGWGCVYLPDSVTLLRFLCDEKLIIDSSDIIKELITQTDWNEFYKTYPIPLKWVDQPEASWQIQ